MFAGEYAALCEHWTLDESHARSSILNGYDAVRQEADIAGRVLGSDLDGVLPIDELLGIEIEVKGRIEGSTRESHSDVKAGNVR